MTEITDLPEQDLADVSDDDLLLVYETSAGSDNSRKVTRQNFLDGLARNDGDHDFGTCEIQDLTAIDAVLNDATVTNGLTFDGSATITDVWVKAATLAFSNITDGNGETVTTTLTGIATTDYLSCAMAAILPDGVSMQAWISAADTVSVRLFNTSGGTITGSSRVAMIKVVKAA